MKSILIEGTKDSDIDLLIKISERLGLKSNIILNEDDEDQALLNAMKEASTLDVLSKNEKDSFIKSLSS